MVQCALGEGVSGKAFGRLAKGNRLLARDILLEERLYMISVSFYLEGGAQNEEEEKRCPHLYR